MFYGKCLVVRDSGNRCISMLIEKGWSRVATRIAGMAVFVLFSLLGIRVYAAPTAPSANNARATSGKPKKPVPTTATTNESAVLSSQIKAPFPGIRSIVDSMPNISNGWTKTGHPPRFTPDKHALLAQMSDSEKWCSEILAREQWRQDIVMMAFSKAHFDNCAFEESLNYIEELLSGADKLLAQSNPKQSDIEEALGNIGRIMHAVQDFYAHSNYIEKMNELKKSLDRNLVVKIWTADGRTLFRHQISSYNLFSGRYGGSQPWICNQVAPTHRELAKDSAETVSGKKGLDSFSRTGYIAAFEVARFASEELLEYAYGRWPILVTACGPTLIYIKTIDDHEQVNK